MTAAELVIDEPRGATETADLAGRCANLWGQALGQYYKDAQSAWRGSKQPHDHGEALEDLLGSRELLANLLGAYGGDMDADVLGDLMLEAMEAGRRFTPSAMTRPVPEVVEDYSGLDGWRGKGQRSTWRTKHGGLGPLSGAGSGT
ncbi:MULTISPECIES: hypothetical protein [Halomonas]|uniref:NTP pyrophosphohydrolase MazG putative catalytic core domain-containing protein n=1 Tax=Halomonas halophila TaxID=29573 RepID=A0ABQ0U385_9GAMM|nr:MULTISPECIES: hypothetical protein [Halomonas]MDR5890285.1 hypothetical protein [Halomonas salina]WJY05797.1 hypothetical protein QWG60_08685 [Halomonas halophila]GEK72941.1 hypothetical protein HHA04nite_14850 [Halomonas halophila]